MKNIFYVFLFLCFHLNVSKAQLTVLSSFDPANASTLCGIGYSLDSGQVWVYGCFEGTIQQYTDSGVFVVSVPVAGEAANDCDVAFAPELMTIGSTSVAPGTLLFINGETDTAEVYAIDGFGAVIDTLKTSYGVSHTVGGSYHAVRNTFFLVEDNVPGAIDQNRIAEIDMVTGDTIQSFQTTGTFSISYGDVDVSPVSGNLFIVSSDESTIAEYTPTGTLVMEYPLPPGVASLSGIAIDCNTNSAWVSSTLGNVYHLGQFPCVTAGMDEHAQDASVSFYPNPFSSTAKCIVSLKVSTSINLALYDVTGREVREVYNGKLQAGRNEIDVNSVNLQPGLYILKDASGKIFFQKKLMHN